ncbi:diguanylate cyclase or its enzymatically inactive variants [Pseudomonas syringae pv. actinidiae]|uniref:Diguanylate cyclase or its enzymatically inactive variants n=1 Tax=Pseudomonas syringae pv. actinidiae TaxID=103796 RepID=A0A2V0QKY1_PSESF|nr:diguanylate cyclase or its enzymatically inactive variants [Pseudomonas syringae pv. actinidiae]
MAHFGTPKGTESIRGSSFLQKAILKSHLRKNYPFEPLQLLNIIIIMSKYTLWARCVCTHFEKALEW